MDSPFPLVALTDLITLERRPIIVFPDQQYQEIGVYCFGKGIFHKEPRSGLLVGDKNLFRVKDGDFIIQITFAWEGAVALAGAAEDGMYCSVRFPTFRVNEERCYAPFLVNYFRTKSGVDQLLRICPGSAGRNRVLSMNRLSEVIVPVPALSEQRRIVARIEELEEKIAEAKQLRGEAVEDGKSLLEITSQQIFDSPANRSYQTQLENADVKLNSKTRDPRRSEQSQYFTYIDISSVDRDKKSITNAANMLCVDAPSRARRVVNCGDVIFSTVRPNLKCAAKISDQYDGQVCSTGFAVFTCGKSILSDFLFHQILSPFFINQCLERVTGGHYPAINDENLRRVTIAVPPIEEQKRIIKYLDGMQTKIEALKREQAESAKELDTLLPAILDRAFRGQL